MVESTSDEKEMETSGQNKNNEGGIPYKVKAGAFLAFAGGFGLLAGFGGALAQVSGCSPVLKINDHATGGRRTKDILGGPKGWGPKKKVTNVEIYVIFEVFAYCGGRTKTDFKDRVI